ncbi:MAG: flippase activity-associated protein Agl23 [Aggregatilineales bacterium]
MSTTYPRQDLETPSTDSISQVLARGIAVNWYTLAYIAILVIAIVTRFAGLGDRVMSHDESLHTYFSYLLFRDGNFQHTPLMHGPILFHVTAFMYFLFGDNDFTARIYPAVLGVLMVLFPLLFRRWLGRTGALLASIFILISPMLLYHHRYIREDTPALFATLIMVWCLFMYVDGPLHLRRKARWLYIFSAALLWNFGTKETAFMYVAIFGLFLTIFWVVRLLQHFRGVPGKTAFYFLIIPTMLGGVVSLVMYAVLSIALATYPTLEGRAEFLVQQIANIGTSAAVPLEFSLFSSWTLLLLAATIAIIAGTALYAFRKGTARLRLSEILIILALTLVVTTGLIVFEEVSKLPSRSEALIADPEADVIRTQTERTWPIALTWIIAGVVIAAVLYSWRAGWWRTLYRFPELDMMILMATLILPWLTALPVSMTGASPTDYSPAGIGRSLLVLIPLAAISVTVGLVWNWKRWLISAAIFHILFAFFFTTMFTNPQGLATGMVGSLGYWLEQQGVRRGGQPQYYYQLIIMPIYEYLALIGSFLAMLAGLVLFWKYRRERAEARSAEADPELKKPRYRFHRVTDPAALKRLPFALFIAFWGVYIFQALTLAGEKMPWLATHITLPLLLLSAWYFGRVFDRIDWAMFRQRGWLFLLLLPLLFFAFFQVLFPFIIGLPPLNDLSLFGALSQEQQQTLNVWLAMLAVSGVIIWLIYRLARSTNWLHLRQMVAVAGVLALSVLTARHAWMAAFINYDLATEYIVYAHAAPGIKIMMDQIEELSRRTTGDMSMRFAWGGNNWPVTWYFRVLTNATYFANNPTPEVLRDAVAVYASEDIRARVEPLLEDRYYRFDYMRMWWPSWNYYNLNAQRVTNALDFSPANRQASEIRHGMFDIWWARDYTRYGAATGEDYSLRNWTPGERMYFYVRKDIAAQVWNLGVGEGTVMNPLENITANLCTENWQPHAAMAVFRGPDGGQMTLNRPVGVAVGPDGRVYVAEEASNRVAIFTANGDFVGYLDAAAPDGRLNRPYGLAVDADGNIYVTEFEFGFEAIGRYAPDGTLVSAWGRPGQFGAAAQTEPVDGLWGPRAVALDAEGNVYIADTGNKRVRVYTPDGQHLRDIGGAGSGFGQLDEPVGLAVSADGRLFVADTWNRRISVFALDGSPLYVFDVRGWYEDQGNRPYLAFDDARGLLYVGDPDGGRVLVFNADGSCVGSFGQPTDVPIAVTQFNTVSGLAVDSEGNIYVADLRAGRVLKFPPFPVTVDLSEGMQLEQIPVIIGDDEAGPLELPLQDLDAQIEQDLAGEIERFSEPEPTSADEIDAAG